MIDVSPAALARTLRKIASEAEATGTTTDLYAIANALENDAAARELPTHTRDSFSTTRYNKEEWAVLVDLGAKIGLPSTYGASRRDALRCTDKILRATFPEYAPE